jgi:hypothetical protein
MDYVSSGRQMIVNRELACRLCDYSKVIMVTKNIKDLLKTDDDIVTLCTMSKWQIARLRVMEYCPIQQGTT